MKRRTKIAALATAAALALTSAASVTFAASSSYGFMNTDSTSTSNVL